MVSPGNDIGWNLKNGTYHHIKKAVFYSSNFSVNYTCLFMNEWIFMKLSSCGSEFRLPWSGSDSRKKEYYSCLVWLCLKRLKRVLLNIGLRLISDPVKKKYPYPHSCFSRSIHPIGLF